ncbi:MULTISPECIES: PQQ-dependent sugar dehydrogenase [unclassified Methylobacterium]|uniref:PQQ-dependent sugar dehydrogenase n=1 Tax=unclassified Methylobacterium TaxID=2615210 RepID=UPI0006FB829C|nr:MULTISPECIES: PQQ-dependent sugar dehydrogenase [unclassified Methylobacterium]KQO66128.1 sorbosone dehydrogenase [Methylobacterium sp. Leaf89]KQO73239.1 sorbosone dehydrogenase [Methylobacterium sp. Leaf88]KQP68796.1 sorbosone dehydrogenase [Methylobacterium sp. Leaf111]KQT81791.1 sorbosone dehydrogenase [Methylobacterium sp. Leaf465]
MRSVLTATLLAGCAALAFTAGARAQGAAPAETKAKADALEKLTGMQGTGTAEAPEIPQTGRRADALRRTLAKIKLPDGFKIDLYAVVPDARSIAVGPNAGVLFVGTRKSKVYTVTDRDKDRVADEVRAFAPGLDFKIPNGVCFSKDGVLTIVEQNRVLSFPAAEFFYESPDVAAGVLVKQGDLIPAAEESYNHTARMCRVGPDGKTYISLGQPYNVPPAAKRDLYAKTGIGGIIRMDADGKNREVYATGIRNSVGMDFNPADKALWFTDNQVDGMGDDIPPGELNRIAKAGENFGFPWFGGGQVRTVEYKDETPPKDVVFPQAELPPHAADLGMTFYNGRQFPDSYKGGIFTAEHGSWNRTQPLGARIMFVPIDKDGKAGAPKPFAEGWLTQDGEYLGRPTDVAVLLDGSLLVADDTAGAIYRISYEGK